MALGYIATLRNAQLDAITTAIGSNGKLRIYGGGSGRPATGAAITDQTLLAELPLSATAAGAASGGTLTLNAITQDSSADASGTAAWFRIVTSGNAAVVDGNVGTSGSDLNLNSTSITAGGSVAVTSFTITAGNA